MFSYISATDCDSSSPPNKQNVDDLLALTYSSHCLTPRPEPHIVSHIGHRLQIAESPQQIDQCWTLLVHAINSSPHLITPSLRSQIPHLTLRDVRVSSACVSAVVALLERFVRNDTSFAAALLPALVHVQPSAHLVRVIRSFSAVHHNQEMHLQILNNIQALISSPLWKKHLIHLRPLLPTHSHSAESLAYIINTPQACFAIPFLFRVTSKPDLSSLVQNLLTALLDRLSSLLPADRESILEPLFSHYIATLAVTFRLGAAQLTNTLPLNPQKKRRVEVATEGSVQTKLLQKLFLVLGDVISRTSSTPIDETTVTNVALCIRLMLRHCFYAIEGRVSRLLDALISGLSKSCQSHRNAHQAILLDLVVAHSESGRLATFYTHLRSRAASKSFPFYAESILCTPRVLHKFARAAASLQLEEAGQCLKALIPKSENFENTPALFFLRLACLTIESLMKKNSGDLIKCVKHACSSLLQNTSSRAKYALWYFLSSMLIHSTRVGTPDFVDLLGFLHSEISPGQPCAQPLERFGTVHENHREANRNIGHLGVSEASFGKLLAYLDGLVSGKMRPVDIVCFIRLSSAVFQILLDITRNDRPFLSRFAPDLLKNILHSYRELYKRGSDATVDVDRTLLWDRSAIEFASRMLILLLEPVDRYLVEGEFDDVFKHSFQILAYCNDPRAIRWGELMNKQCFIRGVRLSIDETMGSLDCSKATCDNGCSSSKLLATMDSLVMFFNDEMVKGLREKLARIEGNVTCEESKSIIHRLSTKLGAKGSDELIELSKSEKYSVELRAQSEVYLEVQPIVWKLFKLLIGPKSRTMFSEERTVNGEYFEGCKSCHGLGMSNDGVGALRSDDISELVQTILKRKVPRRLVEQSKDWVGKTAVVMCEMFSAVNTQKFLTKRRLQDDHNLKRQGWCVCRKQDSCDESTNFSAKVLTACAFSHFSEKDQDADVEKVLTVLVNNEDTELFEKYIINWIDTITAGQMWDEYDSGKVLTLCHAIVKGAENSKLDNDMHLKTACYMLRVVCQIMTVPSEPPMKMCFEAVQALESTVRSLCKGENGARPCEKSWRSLTASLAEVVKTGMDRARADGQKYGFDGKYGQRLAATLVNLSAVLLQYGVGGRWFMMDLCCAAMRYAGAMGGHRCNEAVGNALKIVDRCRQQGMMSNERIARLIMVGAEAGPSEKIIEALGSLLSKLPVEIVSHLLRQASPQSRSLLQLAQQQYSDKR